MEHGPSSHNLYSSRLLPKNISVFILLLLLPDTVSPVYTATRFQSKQEAFVLQYRTYIFRNNKSHARVSSFLSPFVDPLSLFFFPHSCLPSFPIVCATL